jgi:hypothetical protein
MWVSLSGSAFGMYVYLGGAMFESWLDNDYPDLGVYGFT